MFKVVFDLGETQVKIKMFRFNRSKYIKETIKEDKLKTDKIH